MLNNLAAIAAYGILGLTVCYIFYDIVRHDVEWMIDRLRRRWKKRK